MSILAEIDSIWDVWRHRIRIWRQDFEIHDGPKLLAKFRNVLDVCFHQKHTNERYSKLLPAAGAGSSQSKCPHKKHRHLVPCDYGIRTVILIAATRCDSLGCEMFDPCSSPMT